jgi:hypothetical protein
MDQSDRMSRKEAALYLELSERTIDKYRVRGLLHIQRAHNKRIWLSRAEVAQLKEILLGKIQYVQACDPGSYLIPPDSFPRYPKRPYLSLKRYKEESMT